jgi:menaquinone-dependent protoporphyrinogen oxidase
LVDLAANEVPDPALFDRIVVGSPVYLGRPDAKVLSFCAEHRDLLLQRELGLFLCGLKKLAYEQEVELAFAEALRHHAKRIEVFGGNLNFDELSFFEKMVAQSTLQLNHSVQEMDEQKIAEYAQAMLSPAEKSANKVLI